MDLHPYAEELGLLALEILDDLGGDVDADLIGQRDRSHRVAKVGQRLVELHRVGTLLDQRHGLGDGGAEASVDIETGHVAHHHDRLALFDPDVDSRSDDLRGGALV